MCEHKAVDFDVSSGNWVCRKCGIAVGMAGMMMSIAHREEDHVKEADFTGNIIAKQIKPNEDIEQLHACRAALRDCLYQMENCSKASMKYGQAEAFVKAITNARKALGEK